MHPLSHLPRPERRHDIDVLRVAAFALLIGYHTAMFFVADWPWHLKSPDPQTWLQWPMRALNLWRMDLLFLISGMALAWIWSRQPPGALWRERSRRLLVPLAFGMLAVVPVQAYLQARAGGFVPADPLAFALRYLSLGAIGGRFDPAAFDGAQVGITWNHLWYLPYLWLYTGLLLAAAPLLGHPGGQRALAALRGLRRTGLLLLPAVPLVLAGVLLAPRFAPTHDLVGDVYLHARYLWVFVLGFAFGRDTAVADETARLHRRALLLAALAFAFNAALVLTLAPADGLPWLLSRLARDLYTWWMLLGLLGLARAHVRQAPRWLAAARDAVFPWYVLHQSLILVAAWLLLQHAPALPAGLQALVIVAATVGGCALSTAAARPWPWLAEALGLPVRRRGSGAGQGLPDSHHRSERTSGSQTEMRAR